MDGVPGISEQAIEERVGGRSFRLGQEYAERGAIFEARRLGPIIRARCRGSQGGPYNVQATVDERGGIAEAECGCPIGEGGTCKHTAALLLTWLHNPALFADLGAADASLEDRSKEELIALIHQMLRQHPELELLLETPLPVPGKPQGPVDPAVYRRQAQAAFAGARDGEWGVEGDIATELGAIAAIGEGFLAQGDAANAAAVYAAVTSVVLEHFEDYNDEGWELGGVIRACVEALGRCLAGLSDDAFARGAIMATLFAVYRTDMSLGGIDLSAGVPELLTRGATPSERRLIAERVRAELPAGGGWSVEYRRRAYGGLLLELEADGLDDEGFIRVARETGREGDLVERLLRLGRLDEAIAAAEGAGDFELLALAERFVAHGHGEVAERLVRERSTRSTDRRLLEYLRDRAVARDDPAAALGLAEQLFRLHPNLQGYREARRFAEPLGRWEALRRELLGAIDEGRHDYLRIEIALDEGDLDAAVGTLERRRPGSYIVDDLDGDITLRVAAAAEPARPEAALRLYAGAVERRLALQGRGNYREAATILVRMRDLYERLARAGEWATSLAELRARTSRLRAFRDELTKAGL